MTYFVQNPYNGLKLNIDNPEQLDTEEHYIPDSFKNLLILVKPQLEILDDIDDYFEYKSNKTTELGDIKHAFIHRYILRGGSVLVALYKCAKKTKLIWYYTTTTHHSKGGVSPSIETLNNLKIRFHHDEKCIELFKRAKKDMVDNEKIMILKYQRRYKVMSLWNWLKNCPLYQRNTRLDFY